MKRALLSLIVVLGVTAIQEAKVRSALTIYDTRKQTVTGFGAACCDGAMCPFGNDTSPVKKLYGSSYQKQE